MDRQIGALVLEQARRRRRLLAVAGLTIVVLVAVGLRETGPSDDGCDARGQAPAADLALLPPRFSFAGVGTVTRVTKDRRYLTVLAVTTKPLDEATVLIQDAVTAAGYRPAGMDNEGFEAEVFFTTGRYAAGQARLRRSACAGRWDIVLVLLDRRSG